MVGGQFRAGSRGGDHPPFDFDNRSVTQAQGCLFSFSPWSRLHSSCNALRAVG